MPSFIRDPKDFWSGVIFVVVGVAAVVIGRDYPMGTAGKMGPAYFPTMLGAALAVIGTIAVIRSLIRAGEAIEPFALKKIFWVILSVVLFGLIMRGAGLFAGVCTIVLVSGFASAKFRLWPLIAVAIVLAIFCVLIFVKALGLPMPIVGTWLAL